MFGIAVVHTDPPSPGNQIGDVVYHFPAKKCLMNSVILFSYYVVLGFVVVKN